MKYDHFFKTHFYHQKNIICLAFPFSQLSNKNVDLTRIFSKISKIQISQTCKVASAWIGTVQLGAGFKDFLFLPLPEDMIPFH